MDLPATITPEVADELLTDLALSSNVDHRWSAARAIHDSASDPAMAALWHAAIRRAARAGRLAPEIACYLIMRCSDAAANSMMTADDKRFDEERAELDRKYGGTEEDDDDDRVLTQEYCDEWNACHEEIDNRRDARMHEFEMMILRAWGEAEIAGWIATDIDTFCDHEELGMHMFFGDRFSDPPGARPWVLAPRVRVRSR